MKQSITKQKPAQMSSMKEQTAGEAQGLLWIILILFDSSIFEFSSAQKDESTINSIYPKKYIFQRKKS